MNRALLAHTWRANRWRLLIVSIALVVWGSILPIIYDAFGSQFEEMMNSGLIPEQFAEFGGGDVFSLAGSVALGFIHPIAVGLNLVFALGFAASAVAGERQRGTLEVLLARPLSRRVTYGSLAVAAAFFVAVTVAALTAGSLVGSALTGRVADLGPGNLPIMWLNGFLLFAAFAAISLAASVSFDRLTPAIGISLAIVLVSYFLDVLGDLWPDAKGLQPLSLFNYLDARAALTGVPDPVDFAVLGGVILVAVVYALIVFPRRDLAAPS
jgi:ABC-type transport system involved in multi-copper enzyme maturation permease subunit